MTTHRDLREARAFERRRLVRAFVTGTAEGSGVEPPRPGRCLVGGLVLAVILLSVAAVAAAREGRLGLDPAPSPGLAHAWVEGNRVT
jgi:hypothetical protein